MDGFLVAHKAAIFPRRPDRMRQAKDVLYLIEIMSAGDDVQEVLAQEVRAVRDDVGVAQAIETGLYNLRLATDRFCGRETPSSRM